MALFGRFLTVLTAAAFFCLIPLTTRAEVTWDPSHGYSSTGSDLGTLRPEEARKVLSLINEARRTEEQGETGAALKKYKQVYKKYPNSVYAPEAYFRTAQVLLDRKKYQDAFDAYDSIVRGFPGYGHFNQIIGQEYKIANDLINGAHGRWFFGLLPGFTNREKGIEYFERIIINAPYSDYAPLSLMNIAKGYLRMKNSESAIDALDRLINSYPNSMLAPDAYLLMAKTYSSEVDGPLYDQGATREAMTYYQDFLILFPNDPKVGNAEKGLSDMREMMAESKMKMASFYGNKRHNYVAARILYNEAITVAPTSKAATQARAVLEKIKDKADKQQAAIEAAAQRAAERAAHPEQYQKKRSKFLGIF